MAHASRHNFRPLIGAGAAVAVLALAGWAFTRSGSGHREVAPPPAAIQPAVSHAEANAPSTPAATPAPAEPRLLATENPPAQADPGPILELHQGTPMAEAPTSAERTPSAPTLVRNPDPAPTLAPAAIAPPAPAAPASFGPGVPGDLAAVLGQAQEKRAAGDLVASRQLFSRVLADARTPEADRATLRGMLSEINEDLVFSPRIAAGDPFVSSYVVQPGDGLIKIAQALKAPPDYRLIARINRTSAKALRIGQKLKIITVPFHAVVSKSAFRLDVWMGPIDKPEQWVYVRSFGVGLGAADSETPIGTFVVKKGSKLVNPPWTHPKTGEHFEGGSARNPLGKFWIGLEGTGESSAYAGYGIHGTIEPDSIGQRRSMGCVRLADADIALMYELMGERLSTVQIVP
jgi:hypothetical protein